MGEERRRTNESEADRNAKTWAVGGDASSLCRRPPRPLQQFTSDSTIRFNRDYSW